MSQYRPRHRGGGRPFAGRSVHPPRAGVVVAVLAALVGLVALTGALGRAGAFEGDRTRATAVRPAGDGRTDDRHRAPGRAEPDEDRSADRSGHDADDRHGDADPGDGWRDGDDHGKDLSGAGPARGWDGDTGDDEYREGRDWDGRDGGGHALPVRGVDCDAESLIEAVVSANADNGGHLRLAHGCTYTLTVDRNGTGLPDITASVTIEGEGARIVRGAGTPSFRIFRVRNGGHLTLHDVVVSGGEGTVGSGGGGILVEAGGTALVDRGAVSRNTSFGSGGGLANAGIMVLNETKVSDNTAGNTGGGIRNTGVLKINRSVVEHNTTQRGGAGLADTGTTLISRSRLADNRASQAGGGVRSTDGAITAVEFSLVSGNIATTGGGLYASGATLNVRHVTVTRNNATGSGGGAALVGGSRATIENSAIVGNIAGANAGGLYVSGSTVVVRDSEIRGNLATGPTSRAGGVRVEGSSTLDLVGSDIVENVAAVAPGGLDIVAGTVTLDSRTTVSRNRPANCRTSAVVPPTCFV